MEVFYVGLKKRHYFLKKWEIWRISNDNKMITKSTVQNFKKNNKKFIIDYHNKLV